MNYLAFIVILCLAYTAKKSVVLTHEAYICTDNPDCFTLLIQQQKTILDAVSQQLKVQQRQLDVQKQQLNTISKLGAEALASTSVLRQTTSALVSNVVYITIFGIAVSVAPWVLRKLIGLRQKLKEERIGRDVAAAVMLSARSRVYGSGHDPSEQQNVPGTCFSSVEMRGMASDQKACSSDDMTSGPSLVLDV